MSMDTSGPLPFWHTGMLNMAGWDEAIERLSTLGRRLMNMESIDDASPFVFQGEWSVHHGRTGLQLPLHHGRSGLYNSGPLQCTKHSQAQPLPAALHRVCQRPPQLLHGQSVHAHEAPVSLNMSPTNNKDIHVKFLSLRY